MADQSYEIDINVSSGTVSGAAAALSNLEAKLSSGGTASSAYEQALAKVRMASEAAASSVTATAAAVAAGEASYATAEAAADRAAKAVERIGLQLDAQQGKLSKALETGDTSGVAAAEAAIARLSAKKTEAASKAAELAAAVTAEAAALDGLRSAASAAEAEQSALAQTSKQLESGMKSAAEAEAKVAKEAAGSGQVNEMGEALGRMGGPAGAAGQKMLGLAEGFKKASASMGAAGPYVALAVLIVAITTAAIVGTAAIAAWAVGLADTNRSAQLSTQALSRTSDSLKDLGNIMPAVTDATGVQAAELQELAKQLDGAKVSAKDMPAALEAAAIAESALGKGGSKQLIEDLKSGKKSAGELAAEMKSKFGDIVAKQMISLGATGTKLKGNIAEIFGGLKIEGLLAALSKGADLLDKNSASGKALKFLFESIFQPLIDGATAAYPTVERIFLGLVLGALKFYNATKPLRNAISEVVASLMGGEGSIEWLDVGVGLFYALAGSIATVVAFVALMAAPFAVVVAVIYGFYAACMAVFEAVGGAIRSAMDIDLSGAASAMIDGLVAGITSGAARVVSAVTNLASSAVGAAESALGIASPSKVFAKIGGYTSEGMAEGVDDGAGEVDAAMTAMVAPPDAPPPQAAQGGAAAGTGLNLAGAQFIFQGVPGMEDAENRLRSLLAQLIAGGSLPAPAGGTG